MHADFTKTGHGRNAGYLLIFPVFLQNTDPDTATYRGLEVKTTMINILFVPVPGWKIEITTICSCVRGVLLRYFCQTYSYSTNSRNIISFSDQRASKWIFFVFRRVKLVYEFYSDVSKYAIMISHGEEKQRRFHAMNLPTDVPILHSYA